MRVKSGSIILILGILLCSNRAFAAPLFGAEFTFTNIDILEQSEIESAEDSYSLEVEHQRKLKNAFTAQCVQVKKCVVEEGLDTFGRKAYKVHFPEENFWLQISTDPKVVEVQSKPMTSEEYTKAKPWLDRLFKSADQTGIWPDYKLGGGHIHMDVKTAFHDDPILFRNFMVDFMNHDELGGLGVFGSENTNAPHLKRLSKEQIAAFHQVIEDFDKGKIQGIKNLADAVNTRVYTSNPAKWIPAPKYQALNLTRVGSADGFSTVEFRAISPQRNPEEFLKQIKLFEARVEYLRKQKSLIPFQPFRSKNYVDSFKTYVEESGLRWDDYQPVVRIEAWTRGNLDSKPNCANDFAHLTNELK